MKMLQLECLFLTRSLIRLPLLSLRLPFDTEPEGIKTFYAFSQQWNKYLAICFCAPVSLEAFWASDPAFWIVTLYLLLPVA